MAKAGAHLAMSQSAVSQAIAALEDALGVPLLDRMSRGVELTVYGAALMRRGQAAFDELRSGIRDIESLRDPAVGEVSIACTESIAAGVLPSVIERFSLRHPSVKLQVVQTTTHLIGFAALDERKADVVLTLLPKPFEGDLAEHFDRTRNELVRTALPSALIVDVLPPPVSLSRVPLDRVSFQVYATNWGSWAWVERLSQPAAPRKLGNEYRLVPGAARDAKLNGHQAST